MADNILIINRLRVVRESIQRALDARTDLEIEPGYGNLDDALDALPRLRPSIVVLDQSESMARDIQRALAAVADSKIVVSGITLDEKTVGDCAAAGAAGYIDVDATDDDWIAAIVGAITGHIPNPAIGGLLNRCLNRLRHDQLDAQEDGKRAAWHVPERVRESARRVGLTPRERQIVSLIDKGFSNKKIAQELHLEPSTVKNHVHSILGKYNVRGRAEAAARFRKATVKEQDPDLSAAKN